MSDFKTVHVSEYSLYCRFAAEFLWEGKTALVFDVTTRTSPSKTVDEIRASVLADAIKRDFLEEILRAAAIRTSKDKRDQRNHKTPHKKRK